MPMFTECSPRVHIWRGCALPRKILELAEGGLLQRSEFLGSTDLHTPCPACFRPRKHGVYLFARKLGAAAAPLDAVLGDRGKLVFGLCEVSRAFQAVVAAERNFLAHARSALSSAATCSSVVAQLVQKRTASSPSFQPQCSKAKSLASRAFSSGVTSGNC